MLFTRDTRTFEEKLDLGNEKEDVLIDFLNLSGIKAKKNNDIDVTDIDIELTRDNMYLDAKYMGTPFYMAYKYTGLQPENCLTMQSRHIKSYVKKFKDTGNEVWVGCIIDYKDYDIYELRFFPITYLHNVMVNNNVDSRKVHFERRKGIDLHQFLGYVKSKRKK